jgi:lipopolysaccharide transport system ATP-binding protein
MSDIAIEAHSLSKRYRIGDRERYYTLRDSLARAFTAPVRWFRNGDSRAAAHVAGLAPPTSVSSREARSEFIWALKEISFEVRRGEVIGLIGRNGAGKSTLLKILSRITEPTTGEVRIRGRVGSLLEVGTGFHPELTGRENIYLNGAILGMKKAEIERKFDEIVSFAEIEKFLDTPVKRYSSGMYMRLAFSVAAHLQPEILLVDEVLAVGDVAFQKKCLGKMGDVAKEGRTVLLVSHNMAAIQSLCEKAYLLDNGILASDGPVQEVVHDYLQSANSISTIRLDQRQDRSGDGTVRIVSIQIESTDSEKVIRSDSRLKVTIAYKGEREIHYPKLLVGIYDYTNTGIFLLSTEIAGDLPDKLPPEGTVVCVTEPINLTAGRCYVNVALEKGGVMADYIQYAGYFDVEADDVYRSGKIPPRNWVLCVLPHKWSFAKSEDVGDADC